MTAVAVERSPRYTAATVEATRRDEGAIERAVRQAEDRALAAALRFVAHGIEVVAFDLGGDVRQVPNAARLRGIAAKVEARAEAAA